MVELAMWTAIAMVIVVVVLVPANLLIGRWWNRRMLRFQPYAGTADDPIRVPHWSYNGRAYPSWVAAFCAWLTCK